jgi:hypothetical protein
MVPCMHLDLRLQNVHLPRHFIQLYHKIHIWNCGVSFPHAVKQPNVCSPAQNNSLNTAQITKSVARLEVYASCACTLKSALHRLFPPYFRAQADFLHQSLTKSLSRIFPSCNPRFLARRIRCLPGVFYLHDCKSFIGSSFEVLSSGITRHSKV